MIGSGMGRPATASATSRLAAASVAALLVLAALRAGGPGAAAGPEGARSGRFKAKGGAKWYADLAGLTRDRLAAAGVGRVSGGAWCTVTDASRFFSYRRDGVTGRMAAAVWIAAR